MKRATELHWLKWFYQAADIGLTEEDRIELERQFVKEENLLIPKAYEVDDDPIPLHDIKKEIKKPEKVMPVDEYLEGILNRKNR